MSPPDVGVMRSSWTLLAGAVLLLAGCGRGVPVQDPAPVTDLSTAVGYPDSLWVAGASGQTMLMVHVTDTGRVDTAYVARTSGRTAFDSAALAGIRAARFSPGRRGGRRIDMWVRVPVRFDRKAARPGQKAEKTRP